METRKIKFNEEYWNSIRYERKTTTIRLTDKNLRAGDKVKAVFLTYAGEEYGDDYKYPQTLLIKRISEIQVKNLTEDDAKREDCKNLNELLNILSNIYPELRLNDKVYIFHFENLDRYVPINEKWI